MNTITDLVVAMKKIAINAMDAQKPCNIVYGTVISINPLRVQVEQRLTLYEEQLKLTSAVKDFEVDIIIDGINRTCIIKNALKIGDRVTMIKNHGGQQFIIIDKT